MPRGYTSFLNTEFTQVLVVYGMPGVGKTTARDVLQWLHCNVFYRIIDTDDLYLTDVRALTRYIKDVVREGATAHPIVITNNWRFAEALVKLGSTLIASVRWLLNNSACIKRVSDLLVTRAKRQTAQQEGLAYDFAAHWGSRAKVSTPNWPSEGDKRKAAHCNSDVRHVPGFENAMSVFMKSTCLLDPLDHYSPTEIMSLWSSRQFNQAAESWEPVIHVPSVDPTQHLENAYSACLVVLAIAVRWALELEFRATGAADGLLGTAIGESDELLSRMDVFSHLSIDGQHPATFDALFDTSLKGGVYVYNG